MDFKTAFAKLKSIEDTGERLLFLAELHKANQGDFEDNEAYQQYCEALIEESEKYFATSEMTQKLDDLIQLRF